MQSGRTALTERDLRTALGRRTILVTGGAGFIGSAVCRLLRDTTDCRIVNLDKLSYASSPAALATLAGDPRYQFEQADLCDRAALAGIFQRHRPDSVIHLAAESHVDRSIDGPQAFVMSNVVGTFNLLEACRAHMGSLPEAARANFRLVHVSTDEVYGSLGPADPAFTETTPFAPNSPYAASKAAADHLVRSYHHTYGVRTLTTNCSNNYGPHQFPEKLIPLMISHALAGKPLPVYGDGKNVRDWLYVMDHCAAIRLVLEHGRAGETYNIGGGAEHANINLVRAICALLDELSPRAAGRYAELISFVKDRPGHDRRYAIDAAKIARELGWRPRESFDSGLRKTVQWYLKNQVHA